MSVIAASMDAPRLAMHRRRKLRQRHRGAGAWRWGRWPSACSGWSGSSSRRCAWGFGAWRLQVFTEATPPPQAEVGGLSNAIVGSLMMVGARHAAIGTPIGVLAGIYLAEYGQRTWLGAVTGFINDILLSAPSIVVGLFIYSAWSRVLKSFSGWAGVLALALIVIPVVVRIDGHDAGADPNALREAAYALGTPKWKVIMSVTLKASIAGRDHRRAAGRGTHRRRDRAAAVHGAVQPVLHLEHGRADGQPAGDDLQVRDEPVRELAEAGLGRRLPDHAGRAGA